MWVSASAGGRGRSALAVQVATPCGLLIASVILLFLYLFLFLAKHSGRGVLMRRRRIAVIRGDMQLLYSTQPAANRASRLQQLLPAALQQQARCAGDPPPQGACSKRGEGARTRTHHMRKSVSLSTMMCCDVLSCAGAGEGKGGCRGQHVSHAAAHLVVQHNRKAEGILPAPQARQFARTLQTRALTCSACPACCRRC